MPGATSSDGDVAPPAVKNVGTPVENLLEFGFLVDADEPVVRFKVGPRVDD